MRIDSSVYGGLCRCGKEHQMATRLCVIEPHALDCFDTCMEQLSLSGKRCVVYDSNTFYIPGLNRPRAEQEVILNAEGLHADEVSTAELLARMEPDIEVLVAVGGGTVHDIVRFCSKQKQLPFVSVPTAASCDGFCSNVAAMTWHGYKITWPCAAPELVVADLNVISAAPWFLTASGFGDMVAKYVALADWRISHEVTGEAVCPVIYDMMHEAVDRIWANSLALKEQDMDAYEAVTYGLLMSGLAMQMLGTSRPASGGEHHISHFIEVGPAALNASSSALHGEKVGVGTVLVSGEYQRLAAIEDIRPLLLPFEPLSDERLMSVFGPALFEACREENAADCLSRVTPELIAEAWPRIRSIVSEIPASDEIFRRLEQLDARRTLTDIGIPEDRLSVILENSPLIRNRLTLMRMRRMIRH